MTTNVHKVILSKGDTMKISCQDGGRGTNVSGKFDHIYNFGGDIMMKNCGENNERRVLEKASNDMDWKYQTIIHDRMRHFRPGTR